MSAELTLLQSKVIVLQNLEPLCEFLKASSISDLSRGTEKVKVI